MEALSEPQLKKEFLKIINEQGVGRKLGLTKHMVYRLRQPETQTTKGMLHVLFLAKKLSIHEFTATQRDPGSDS